MENEEKQLIKARSVLWMMVFLGTLVNFAIQINFNFAVVDMVYVFKHSKNLHNITDCKTNGNLSISNCDVNVTNLENTKKLVQFSIEKSILNLFDIKHEKNGFHWNEYVQNMLFSSYQWISWLAGVPGGIIARRYGAKKCFGYATLLSSCLCFTIPMAAYLDYKIFIFIRVIQGFLFGIGQCFNIISFWVPPNERSQFVTAYLGNSVAAIASYPIFGYIIAISSWEYVFHLCGLMGIIWFVAWHLLVFDTPAQHPRIIKSEREYIEKSLGSSVTTNTKSKVPWKSILSDCKCWSVILADVGCVCGIGTLLTYSPTYFRVVHKLDVESTGLVIGLPFILKITYALTFSCLVDRLLKSNKFSRNIVRKTATLSSNVLHGCFSLAFVYSGYNTMLCILFLIISITFQGSISAGPYASFVDISPNYSSILFGITTMFRSWIGIIFNMLAGYITYKNQTMEQWRILFTASSTVAIVSGILYIILFDSSIRPWNDQHNISTKTPNKDVEQSNFELKFTKSKEKDELKLNSEERIPFILKK